MLRARKERKLDLSKHTNINEYKNEFNLIIFRFIRL